MSARSATPAPARGAIAWHRVLLLARLVLRELDARLEHEHRIDVNEFDVLITLDNAEGGRLRMTDLAEAVMFSSGGLTRLVGRLQDAGLVRRTPDPNDARSLRAELTEHGAEQLRCARVTHDAVIEELLGSKLTREQLSALERALGRALAT